MRRISRSRSKAALLLVLAMLCLSTLPTGASAHDSRYDHDHESYVFAATRGLNEMDVHPALKVTILPVALVLDLAFLPFALIADAATG